MRDHAREEFPDNRLLNPLNLIKQHSTAKISLKARRKKAAWDDQYMTQIISGKFHA